MGQWDDDAKVDEILALIQSLLDKSSRLDLVSRAAWVAGIMQGKESENGVTIRLDEKKSKAKKEMDETWEAIRQKLRHFTQTHESTKS